MGEKKRTVKDENFTCTFGWMVNPDKLNLSGMELSIYAIIYGFSQTQDQYFTGSLQYLIEWTNSSRRAVINNLNSLVDKGLIIKEEVSYNKYRYKAVVQNVHHENDGAECAPDGAECAPNNIDNNINIYSSNKRARKTTPIKHKYGEFKHVKLSDEDIDKLKKLYGQNYLEEYIKRLDEYIESTDKRYKNHYLTIRNWIKKDLEKNKSSGTNSKKNSFNNFEQRNNTDFDALEKILTGGTR